MDGIVGRRAERDALLAAVAGAAVRPAVVLVAGEAGIGKTTLIDDVARAAASGGRRVVRGNADDRDVAGLALWAGPRRSLGLDAGVFEAAGQSQDGRWDVLDELAQAMDAAAPLLVVLEDVHWADEPSRWLLSQLGSRLTGDVAVVASSREPTVGRLRPTATVRLHGLDVASVAAIAGADADAEALHARTGGNPLFVREVLAQASGTDLPVAVGDALADHVGRLDPDVRPTIVALALAGTSTPYVLLGEALGLDLTAVRAHLDAALAAEILVAPTPASVAFRHALIADAVVASVEPSERRRVNEGLARAWEAVGGTDAAMHRAGHLLEAVPYVDVAEAAAAARAASDAAAAAGDLVGAVHLLTRAEEAVGLYAPGAPLLRARLLLSLGDHLFRVGQVVESIAAFDRAVPLAASDPVLHVEAVLGSARHLHMHAPEPERHALLTAAELEIPPGDHPLRARILSRLSVAEAGDPGTWDDSVVHGDAAVAMARRLDDPALLASAIIDRHLCLREPEDFDARGAAAAELLAIGAQLRADEIVGVAWQWLYAESMRTGDLPGAEAAVREIEALAALSPSPQWSYAALISRAVLAALHGDGETAAACIERAAPVGHAMLSPDEAFGMELGVRTIVTRILGRPDPDLPAVLARFDATSSHPAAAFFDVHDAATRLAAGQVDEARRMARRVADWAARPGHGFEDPSITVLLASLVGELGLVEHADAMYARALPYSGMLTAETRWAADLPVDVALARLARIRGDATAAAAHAEAAVAVARRTGSAWLVARTRSVLGAGAEATSPVRAGRLTRTGAAWRVECPYGAGEVTNSVGMGQLARILAAAPRDVAATELAGMTDVAPAHDLGPALDARAKREYRRRIDELRAEIDGAELADDAGRAARAQGELDALLDELKRAVGLGGRDRPTGSGAERARVNVARSVRRAVDAVRAVIPELGAHFDVSIRTGGSCTYAPDPAAAITWTVADPA